MNAEQQEYLLICLQFHFQSLGAFGLEFRIRVSCRVLRTAFHDVFHSIPEIQYQGDTKSETFLCFGLGLRHVRMVFALRPATTIPSVLLYPHLPPFCK